MPLDIDRDLRLKWTLVFLFFFLINGFATIFLAEHLLKAESLPALFKHVFSFYIFLYIPFINKYYWLQIRFYKARNEFGQRIYGFTRDCLRKGYLWQQKQWECTLVLKVVHNLCKINVYTHFYNCLVLFANIFFT